MTKQGSEQAVLAGIIERTALWALNFTAQAIGSRPQNSLPTQTGWCLSAERITHTPLDEVVLRYQNTTANYDDVVAACKLLYRTGTPFTLITLNGTEQAVRVRFTRTENPAFRTPILVQDKAQVLEFVLNHCADTLDPGVQLPN